MNAVACIRASLDMGLFTTLPLIDDMKDAPLTSPTAKGGNHPLWVLGHLAWSEASMVHGMMLGEPNPLEDWKPIFGDGSEPTADAGAYPTFNEVRAKFDEVRAHTMGLLEKMTDADLDTKCKNCPPDWEAYFGTYGLVLNLVGAHVFMHHGQVADARRSAGRERKM